MSYKYLETRILGGDYIRHPEMSEQMQSSAMAMQPTQRILARKMTKDRDGYVILVESRSREGDMPTMEWVTWLTDFEGNRYWGNYFTDEDGARNDYRDRE